MSDKLEAAKASLARTGYVEQADGRWRGKFYTATIKQECGPTGDRIISFRLNDA